MGKLQDMSVDELRDWLMRNDSESNVPDVAREYGRRVLKSVCKSYEERNKKMIGLLVGWNAHELEADDVLYQLSKIYRREFLELWNEYQRFVDKSRDGDFEDDLIELEVEENDWFSTYDDEIRCDTCGEVVDPLETLYMICPHCDGRGDV